MFNLWCLVSGCATFSYTHHSNQQLLNEYAYVNAQIRSAQMSLSTYQPSPQPSPMSDFMHGFQKGQLEALIDQRNAILREMYRRGIRVPY